MLFLDGSGGWPHSNTAISIRSQFGSGAVQAGDAQARLAIADKDSPNIHVFDVRAGSNEPMETFTVHRAPLTAMTYHPGLDLVISIDERGTFTSLE